MSNGNEDKIQEGKMYSKSEVIFWIDSYNDIFSDFDPRPFIQRAISYDFLQEAKRATKEIKGGSLEMKFLVPRRIRHEKHEEIIKRRLRAHFKRHHMLLEKEHTSIFLTGIAAFLAGTFLMLVAATLLNYKLVGFIFNFLFIVLEPAGWFIFWYGLDQIFHVHENITPELSFYQNMVRSNIIFETLEKKHLKRFK